MTMPHLMNCMHSEEGWCIPCVKELHADFETAENESRRLRQERDELLPVVYAAEEWACGRISATQFGEVIADAYRDGVKGVELMGRLSFLESEEKSLLNEIAYLKASLERGIEQSDTLDKLLSDVGFFETTVDAGPGREVEDASVRLWCDGSGDLLVKIAATTDQPGARRMLNRVFYTEYRLPFTSIKGLYEILRDMDALKPKHQEAQ